MYLPKPDRGGHFSHLSHNSRRLVGETGFLPSTAAPLPFANVYVLWNTLPASCSLIVVIYHHSSLSHIAPMSSSHRLCHCLSSFLEMSKSRWLTHPAFRALCFSTLWLHMNFLSTYLSHLSPEAHFSSTLLETTLSSPSSVQTGLVNLHVFQSIDLIIYHYSSTPPTFASSLTQLGFCRPSL